MAKDNEFASIVVDIIHNHEQYLQGYNLQARANRRTNMWDNPIDEDIVGTSVEFGPVGLLIKQLAHYNCTLNGNLCISSPNECDIDIWNMPWQHLKTAVMSIVQRHRVANLANHRTFTGQIAEIDDNLHKKVISHLGEIEKKLHMHISTGGFWAENQLDEINQTGNLCQHCGQTVQGPEHVLWECQCIHKHRTFKDLSEINFKELPKAILNGLPPAMSTRIHAYFWDREDRPFQPGNKEGVDMGMPNTKFHSNLKKSDQLLLDTLFEKNNIGHSEINARQAFGKFKHEQAADATMPMPYRCTANAPDQINVYTDGSWLFPLKQFLGLGGAGVWWPKRTIDREEELDNKYLPLSDAEKELALHEQGQDGLRVYTEIGGYAGSSTRTELAAGIIAISAHGPIHIGSDSRAFVDTANRYIHSINKNNRIKKPWKLISDGDLWQHFYQAVQAKGTNAIKITWVKGHATEEHIIKGISNDKDKKGNDVADKCADIGAALHGKDLIKLSTIMHRRHNKYLMFMKNVSHHIVEAYMIHRRLVEIKEKQQASCADDNEGKTCYKPLQYAGEQGVINMPVQSTISYFKGYADKNAGSGQVEHFLRTLKVQPASDSLRPITWLEMYILYRLRGYKKLIDDPASKAAVRPSPAKQLLAFKKSSRAVGQRLMTNEDYSTYLSPATQKKQNLSGVAMAGKHACLNINVYVSPDELQAIAQLLVKLTHTLSKMKVDSFLSGDINLKINDLNIKGKVKWDCDIQSLHPPPDLQALCDLDINKRPNINLKINNTVQMHACPQCKHKEPNYVKQFQLKDLDVKLKCVQCNKATPVRLWTCECHKQWHMCRLHGYMNALCSENLIKKQKVATQNPEVKKSATQTTKIDTDGEYAILLAGDLRMVRKRKAPWKDEEDIMETGFDLGHAPHHDIPSNFLGPILKKRFNRPTSV